MGPRGLPRNLCRLMAERGWTQARMGIEAGMPQSTVSAIARGTRTPTLATLRKIRAALGCSWDELLGE